MFVAITSPPACTLPDGSISKSIYAGVRPNDVHQIDPADRDPDAEIEAHVSIPDEATKHDDPAPAVPEKLGAETAPDDVTLLADNVPQVSVPDEATKHDDPAPKVPEKLDAEMAPDNAILPADMVPQVSIPDTIAFPVIDAFPVSTNEFVDKSGK